MPAIEVLIAFTAAAFLMNISPGPSNLYVMARAMAQGTQGGIVAAIGLAAGSLVHVIAAVLGLSAVFAHSSMLYMVIKLTGAFYLIYLGITYWRSKDSGGKTKVVQAKKKPLLVVFQQSVIVEVTNPKTALFFIALLPQFVAPESGPVSQQLLILGIIVTLSALPCDILVAVFSSNISRWLLKHERAQLIQDRISGSILLAMGAYIVSDELAQPGAVAENS